VVASRLEPGSGRLAESIGHVVGLEKL